MKKLTDWPQLWKELVEIKLEGASRNKNHHGKSYWQRKARQYRKRKEKQGFEMDSSRSFIAETLKGNPGSSLLDIGAGIGDWSAFLAPFAGSVTALEPSDEMGRFLTETVKSADTDNINCVQGLWPDIDIQNYDYTLASHSMYGVADIVPFLTKMTDISQKGCFIVSRVLYANTIMAKAAQHVLGHPYDSPCFQVLYNILLDIGIYPNVLMETGKTWRSWTSNSIDEALEEVKNRLGATGTDRYNDFLNSLLEKELVPDNGKLLWPPGNGSALMYWNT